MIGIFISIDFKQANKKTSTKNTQKEKENRIYLFIYDLGKINWHSIYKFNLVMIFHEHAVLCHN